MRNVRILVCAGAFSLISCVVGASTLTVDNVLDPLHGYCNPGNCTDNGVISPDSSNPPVNFGFTVSPGPQTGDYYLVILVPDNEDTAALNASGFAVTGSGAGTATELSTLDWTSGTLPDFLSANDPAFLGGTANPSPANPIGAYLTMGVDGNFAGTHDAGATGFFVFGLNVGTQTLNDPSNPNSNPEDSILTGLPVGSVILGFLNTGNGRVIATANSGAIVESTQFSQPPPPPPPPTVPEPGSMVLLGTGLISVATRLRRKKNA
jgi:hypothetical protein